MTFTKNIEDFINSSDSNSNISRSEIIELYAKYNIQPPSDYIDFVERTNGAEGDIGEGYLSIWSIQEILEANARLETKVHAPEFLMFGSDGIGNSFALKRNSSSSMYYLPSGSLFIENAVYVGDTLDELISFVKKSDY